MNAGELMYKRAKEMNLIDPIVKLCIDVRKEGMKIGSDKWTVHGMLRDLGTEITKKDGIRLPALHED